MVSIFPVIALGSLVLFGILTGHLGILMAIPLMFFIQILVKELYFKNYLEKICPVIQPIHSKPGSAIN